MTAGAPMHPLARGIAVALLAALSVRCHRASGEVGGSRAATVPTSERTTDRAAPRPHAPAPPPVVAAQPAPDEPRSDPAAQRWHAVKDVAAGTCVRVRGVAAVTPGPRLASYLVGPGPKRALSAEDVGALVELVRSNSGFDDSITKRCRPGISIGFELTRKAEAGVNLDVPPATELVLDFGCAKLTVVDTRAPADLHSTYFDPSRSAFVAFAKRVLPGDRDIQKLK